MERQKTIKKSFSVSGKALQTGAMSRMVFNPADADTGIVFENKKGLFFSVSGDIDFSTDRRSRIGAGGFYVETVEHVMAALWGAGIDNVRIIMDSGEPPALDGSARGFYENILGSGIDEQESPRKYTAITKPVWAEEKESFLGIFPAENFKISYLMEYKDRSIGKQFFTGDITEEIFAEGIAPARTFCLKKEAEALLAGGYGKGADTENTLVMDESGPVNNTLRFPDEPVRHKVLDLIGDLFLAGSRLKGRVIALRSGHKLNLELVRKIKGEFK